MPLPWGCHKVGVGAEDKGLLGEGSGGGGRSQLRVNGGHGGPSTAQGSSGVPTCPLHQPQRGGLPCSPPPLGDPEGSLNPAGLGVGGWGGVASSGLFLLPPKEEGGRCLERFRGEGGLVLKLSNVGEGQWTRLDTGREMSPQHFSGLLGG